MTHFSQLVVFIAGLFSAIGPAQARQRVLSTVVYTNHGERIPGLMNDYQRLTPLGTQQLYNAGARLRSQYITPEPNTSDIESPTWGLDPNFLRGDLINVMTTREPYNIASAQAFMQGLYPPIFTNGTIGHIDDSFHYANGTVLEGPLDGIQFAPIWTSGDQTANSLYLKGATNCPMFTTRLLNYLNSTEYQALDEGSRTFFRNLTSQFLDPVYTSDLEFGYVNSWLIYEYLNYQYTHNSDVAQSLDPADLAQAQVLATDWILALYGNATESGDVGSDTLDAIAGRALASLVLNLFADSILSEGTTNTMNLIFGDQIAMVSFAALAKLMVRQSEQFLNLPAPGASFVFELYADVPENSTTYPSNTDMFVNFLYTNGTDEDASTRQYSLFGASPSRIVTLGEFISDMRGIMINNRTQWCDVCQSSATFCIADSAANPDPIPSHRGLSPAVAGVIGALVTLVFALLVLAMAMLLGGVRLYRLQKRPKSELGGFKGAEKLASDLDLALPKGGAGAMVTETNAQDPRGHERVGSWELRDQKKNTEVDAPGPTIGGTIVRRASFEDDEIHVNPFSDPVRPRDSL